MIPQNAIQIMRRLELSGFQAFLVGGFVRDYHLGIQSKDQDIATNARPEQIMEAFGGEGKVLSPSQAFPVVLVQGIEIATFRRDLDATSRQDVRVEYSDRMEDDASRRDFTVNALYMNRAGQTFDPTDQGREDLEGRLIRFVGDPRDRLREDPLRALRAVRFAARLGFSLELKTRMALYEFSKYYPTC